MNNAHRLPIFETRFLSDGPQEFPRPFPWARFIHFTLSAIIGLSGLVGVVGFVAFRVFG